MCLGVFFLIFNTMTRIFHTTFVFLFAYKFLKYDEYNNLMVSPNPCIVFFFFSFCPKHTNNVDFLYRGVIHSNVFRISIRMYSELSKRRRIIFSLIPFHLKNNKTICFFLFIFFFFQY